MCGGGCGGAVELGLGLGTARWRRPAPLTQLIPEPLKLQGTDFCAQSTPPEAPTWQSAVTRLPSMPDAMMACMVLALGPLFSGYMKVHSGAPGMVLRFASIA